MKNKVRAAILLAVMLGPASAWAGSITEAQLRVVPGGHASYGTKTGHGIVSGYGIGINELVSSSETLNILMGRLTFVTGKATGSNGNSFLFGPGGKFTVRGCVDVGGHSERWCHKNDIRGTLMTGTFLSAKVFKQHGEIIVIAQFLEQLNPQLAAILKLPIDSTGMFDLVLSPSWNHSDPVTGGFFNFPTLPEPSSIYMLATGLLALYTTRFFCRS